MNYITLLSGEKVPEFDTKILKAVRSELNNCAYHTSDGGCRLLPESPRCPQFHTFHICCKYFKQTVLPANKELEAECLDLGEIVKCERCGKKFRRTSNRQKYCEICSKTVRREKDLERKSKRG